MELTPEQQTEVVRRIRAAFPDAQFSPPLRTDDLIDSTKVNWTPEEGVTVMKKRGLERKWRKALAESMSMCESRVCNAWAEVIEDAPAGPKVGVMVSGSNAAVNMRRGDKDWTWVKAIRPYVQSTLAVTEENRARWVPISVRCCETHLTGILNRVEMPVMLLADDQAVYWWREGHGCDVGSGGAASMFRGKRGWRYLNDGHAIWPVPVFVWDPAKGSTLHIAEVERYRHAGPSRPFVIEWNGYRCVKCGEVMYGWDPQGIPWCQQHIYMYGWDAQPGYLSDEGRLTGNDAYGQAALSGFNDESR